MVNPEIDNYVDQPLTVAFEVFPGHMVVGGEQRSATTVTISVRPEALKHVNEDGRVKIKVWLQKVAAELRLRIERIDPPLATWRHR